MLSRFHPIPERYGQTDGQTDLLYQYRDKNRPILTKFGKLQQILNPMAVM